MIFAEEIIAKVIDKHQCCEVFAISVSMLQEREKKYFDEFFPESRTAIVLCHHIVTTAEWTWYSDDYNREHCAADNHCKNICEELKQSFKAKGFDTKTVPYPDESGLQFRFVAEAAGAGEIGINAFLLHSKWGPWVHLRILATNAICKTKPIPCKKICIDCGRCISECPAGAIQKDSFNGLLCRSYRKAKGEYVPSGPERKLDYCTICADVCPIGKKPA